MILYNAALNRPAFMSSRWSRDSGPSLANDGDFTTSFHVGVIKCAASRKQVNPWWAVDLGRQLHVHSVKLTNRGDCCGMYRLLVIITLHKCNNLPV